MDWWGQIKDDYEDEVPYVDWPLPGVDSWVRGQDTASRDGLVEVIVALLDDHDYADADHWPPHECQMAQIG